MHQILLKIKRQRKKLGREVPRVRSQLTMRDETQPTSCGLCFNTSSYVILVKFLRSQFFVHLSVQKYFIAPSAKIVDDHEIRQARMTPLMYYWLSKCPFSLAVLLGCLHMCLLRRSRRRKATNNASEQGVQNSIFCTLLRSDYS